MILHTIVNEYDILTAENLVCQSNFKNINGGIIEYSENEGNKQVVRLHSTNPFLYLKDEYKPYSIIK